jgi:hypothetical protein
MAIAQFPVDPDLTAVAVRYTNRALIADRVSPRVPVGVQSFKWRLYNLAEGFTIPDTRVGRRGAPGEVEFTWTEQSGLCEDFALDDPVPQNDIDNAPPEASPLNNATMGVTDLILLDRERRVANQVFAPATYGTANKTTLSGTSQWSDFTNSDPLDAIITARDGMIMPPNKLVLGQLVWQKLSRHPKIVAAVSSHGLAGGVARREAVAELLELDEILVGAAMLNTARRGQTVSMARVWGKHAALIMQNPLGGGEAARMPTFAWTAQWRARRAGSEYDGKIGAYGGQRVRVAESVDEVISANDLGYLFENAVA